MSRRGDDEAGMDEAGGPAAFRGRTLDPVLDEPAEVGLERVIDKLRLLNYERGFASASSKRGAPAWKLLSRAYFSAPAAAGNANEQFFYFTSLSAWLLSLCGSRFEAPEQYSDPNATCSGLMAELQRLGFPPPQSYQPTKLRSGFGPPIVAVLDGLCDLALEKSAFALRQPRFPNDDGLGDDVDDGEGDEELGDVYGEVGEAVVEGDDDEEAEFGNGAAGARVRDNVGLNPGLESVTGAFAGAYRPAPMLESAVDAVAWAAEVDRVASQLRVVVVAEAKDWRAHLDKVGEHKAAIERAATDDARGPLVTLEAEAAAAVEKLATRERFVNAQLEHLQVRYREEKAKHTRLEDAYTLQAEEVATLTNELARVSKKLEEVKSEMEERGDNLADTKPLARAADAIKRLTGELKAMDIRIGVAQVRLTRSALKEQAAVGVSAKGPRFGAESFDA